LLEKHCYDKIIKLYKNYFGELNVYVYLYEEFNNNPQEFIKSFYANHELNIDIEKINYRKRNASLSKKLLNLKRITNKYTHNNSQVIKMSSLVKRLFNLSNNFHFSTLFYVYLNKFSSTNTKLSLEDLVENDEIEFLKSYFSQSNRKLIQEHGLLKIKDYGYPL